MKSLSKILRIGVIILCCILSFAILIPPVPSEADSEGKLSFLNLPLLISVVLFSISVILFKEKRTIFKLCRYSKVRFGLLTYTICLVAHLLVRALIWKFGHLSEYGYIIHNIVVHSVVYSFVMAAILCFATIFSSREKLQR